MSELTARVLDPTTRPTATEFPALGRPPVIWEDDRWWRFTERTDLHEMRYLAVYEEADLVAVTPLLVTHDGSGLLFYDAPKMAGNLAAFGDPERLPADTRDHWEH